MKGRLSWREEKKGVEGEGREEKRETSRIEGGEEVNRGRRRGG